MYSIQKKNGLLRYLQVQCVPFRCDGFKSRAPKSYLAPECIQQQLEYAPVASFGGLVERRAAAFPGGSSYRGSYGSVICREAGLLEGCAGYELQ